MIDHRASGLEKLVSQFQGSEKLKAYLSVFLDEIQGMQDTLAKIKSERWIDTAQGVQLDGCGYIVGVERYGRSDDDYRQAIKNQVGSSSMIGTSLAIKKLLRFLSSADDIQYLEHYPATAIVLTEGYGANKGLPDLLESVAPASINNIQAMVTFGEMPFRLSKATESRSALAVNGGAISVQDESRMDVGRSAKSFGSGARFSGLIMPKLAVNGLPLVVNGSTTIIASDDKSVKILDNGYHLTGVFQ